MAVDAPAAGTADAIVVAAGASRRMDGIDKLDRIVAGRSLLEWSLAAIAAAPEVESIAVVTTRRADRPDRGGRLAARHRSGRSCRAASVATSPSRPGWPRSTARRRRGERRTGRPRPRRRPAARHRGADRAVAPAAARARRRGPRRGGRRDAETDRGRRRPRDRRPRRAGGRPDAAGRPARRSCARRSSAIRRPGRRPGPTRPPCWRPVPFRSMRSPATPPTSK